MVHGKVMVTMGTLKRTDTAGQRTKKIAAIDSTALHKTKRQTTKQKSVRHGPGLTRLKL
jgi:hypothetical protein